MRFLAGVVLVVLGLLLSYQTSFWSLGLCALGGWIITSAGRRSEESLVGFIMIGAGLYAVISVVQFAWERIRAALG